ncbi:MAG TPA: hypothetical protein VKR60_01730 [Candidatus Sulfotelmatobacter sp.]|nr:hypothetical protein [Candidatus Sulfotelmatobacter sp.]
MKTYFNHLSPTVWALLAIPLVAVAYPVVMIAIPAVLRAVVPETVRAVLSML